MKKRLIYSFRLSSFLKLLSPSRLTRKKEEEKRDIKSSLHLIKLPTNLLSVEQNLYRTR